VDPERIEDLLASDIHLWSAETLEPDQHPASRGTRTRTINVRHLIHTLWTIFQTEDDRARAFLGKPNVDLLAYPLAIELLRSLNSGPEEESPEDESDDEGAGGTYFDSLRTAAQQGPNSLGLADEELVQVLDRVFELSPEMYRAIVDRAREMDLHEVKQQLIAEAATRAMGDEAPVAHPDDDMFKPLDPPKRG
jgi:hypothetical protein